MAEQTLSEMVMNLINWIESLHEKNLKYEAQVETLSRDLARAQDSNEQLEARLSAYQNSDIKATLNSSSAPLNNQISATVHHQQHPQATAMYQPLVNQPTAYAAQPAQCWTYEPMVAPDRNLNMHDVHNIPYFEHYGTTFQQQ